MMKRSDSTPSATSSMPHGDGMTVGVEEEFLLVDPASLAVVPRASDLISILPARLRQYVRHEILETQIEIATPVCRSLIGLRTALTVLRRAIRRAAYRMDCRVMAAGTGIMPCFETPPLVPIPRYLQIAELVGGLIAVSGLSACHVHVGVANRDDAIGVLNNIRSHLPVLQAIGANSPIANGQDTGYASWRSVLVSRWPTSGPTPVLTSAFHFDELVKALQSAGVILDSGMLYWYARPSPRYPTVELRVSDVSLTVDDAVLMAALSRALVRTALRKIGWGTARDVDEHILAAAHWRAAKVGLEGSIVDPVRGRIVPAWQAVEALVGHVEPELVDCGDLAAVRVALAKLRRRGSAAARQRRVMRERRDPKAVAQYVVDQL